jgi:hypothetical protein
MVMKFRVGLSVLILVVVGCASAAPQSPDVPAPTEATTAPAPSTTTPLPTTPLVSAAAADAVALANGSSDAVVVSTTLSTFGADGGGSVYPADTLVWSVRLSGSFPPPSCGGIAATPHPCPPPATTGLILVDAHTGLFLEGRFPAPSGTSPSAATTAPPSLALGSPQVFALPTVQAGKLCAGIGLIGATLTGSPSDVRVAWLKSPAPGGRIDIVFPAAFTARFAPALEILDAAGHIVAREGQPVDGGCVLGSPDQPLLVFSQ